MKSAAYLAAVAAQTATSVAAAASLSSCFPDTFSSILSSHNATVLSAVPLANGSTYGEGAADIPYPTNPTNLPALCALTINVTTSPESNFRFGLFLPTSTWNGRFLTVGNGGFAGGINWLDMGAGVRYGFAVVSTDTGHNSSSSDITWALDAPEKREDFGWRAIHGSTVLGKALTEAFYGNGNETSIKYSYYSGASTGGRQGLREAQYDSEAFDGLLIGAPAWWTSHLQSWTTRLGKLNLPSNASNHIPATLFGAIGDEVISQCDAVDGVLDGIVSAPEQCNFDATALLCGTGTTNSTDCLTQEQITTLKNIYADYLTAPDNKFAFPGLELGSESQWTVLLGGDAPNNLGDEYIQNFLLNDPDWTWEEYTDDLLWQADAQDPGNCTADHYEAMAAVRDGGSKIILFHGTSDGLIATRSSNVFYNRVTSALGNSSSTNMQDWFRYFLVPGMQHVSGTAIDAPWYFAQPNAAADLGTDIYSTPGFEDAQHDALLALMRWVEEGTAPETIVATTWVNTTDHESGVLRQRPLCPWPQRQVYDGVGDVDSAESWGCE